VPLQQKQQQNPKKIAAAGAQNDILLVNTGYRLPGVCSQASFWAAPVILQCCCNCVLPVDVPLQQ
jgi:hypothetical protein